MSDTRTIECESTSKNTDESNSKMDTDSINRKERSESVPTWNNLKDRYINLFRYELDPVDSTIHFVLSFVLTLGVSSLSVLYIPVIPLLICLYNLIQSYREKMTKFESFHFGILSGVVYTVLLLDMTGSISQSILSYTFFIFLICFLSVVYNTMGQEIKKDVYN